MAMNGAKPGRRTYGNGILGVAGGGFEPFSPFAPTLGDTVIMMRESPYRFLNLDSTTKELVARHKSIAFRDRAPEILGVVGGASAATAGLGEGIRKGDARAGVGRTLGRVAGHGPITEAPSERFGPKMPKGSFNAVAIVGIVGANIAYFSGKDRLKEIRAPLAHRARQGKITREQYATVFGDAVDPSAIKKYREYR